MPGIFGQPERDESCLAETLAPRYVSPNRRKEYCCLGFAVTELARKLEVPLDHSLVKPKSWEILGYALGLEFGALQRIAKAGNGIYVPGTSETVWRVVGLPFTPPPAS